MWWCYTTYPLPKNKPSITQSANLLHGESLLSRSCLPQMHTTSAKQTETIHFRMIEANNTQTINLLNQPVIREELSAIPIKDSEENDKGKQKTISESDKPSQEMVSTHEAENDIDANYSSEKNYQVLDDLKEMRDKTIGNEVLACTGSDSLIEPKCGMEFSSIDEMFEFWKNYAKKRGFPVKKRSSKKGDDGVTRYVCFACGRSGTSESKSSNHLKPRANMRTNCKVKFSARLVSENNWLVTTVILDHNHELRVSKGKYFHHNRQINAPAKRRREISDGWIESESQLRYDKLCHSFSKLAYLAAKDEKTTTNILEWIEKMSNELTVKSSTCSTMECIPKSHLEICATYTSNAFVNERQKMLDPLVTQNIVEPPSRRLKPTIPEKSGQTNKNPPTQASQTEEILPSLGYQQYSVSSSTPEIQQLAKGEMREESVDNGILKGNTNDSLIEPESGMEFSTVDELFEFWKDYAKERGFPVKKRSSKKGDDGVTRYVCFACARCGTSKSKSSNNMKSLSNMRTNCQVKFSARLVSENTWLVTTVILDHNHELSPSEVKYCHHNRQINERAKRRLEINDGWIESELQLGYDKLCHSFSKLAYLVANDEKATANILEWIEKMSNEPTIKSSTCSTMEGIPKSHLEICTTYTSNALVNGSQKMLDPLVTQSKVKPPSRRLKPTIPEKSGQKNKNPSTQVSRTEEMLPSSGHQHYSVSSSTPEIQQLAKAEMRDESADNGILKGDASDSLIEPKCGMEFSTVDELFEFWKNYAKEKGFPVKKRSSKKGDDGVTRYVCFACGRSGTSGSKSSNHLKPRASMRTDCKVKCSARLVSEKNWLVTTVILDHNHELSLSKVR